MKARPVFYDVAGHCRRVTGCFVDSGIADERTWPDASAGPALVWGILRQAPEIIASCQVSGRPWLYCDHAYVSRGHHEQGFYRCVWNAYQHNTINVRPPDRWDRLGVKLSPWRPNGSHILVCAPSPAYIDYHRLGDWTQNIVSRLKAHTDRPVIVRTKKDSYAVPLIDALKDCHAVVTHASIAAVEAVIAGVPVFVDECSAAAPVGMTDITMVESPVRSDREEWAWSLAYGQWRRTEILSGEAWRHLEAELAAIGSQKASDWELDRMIDSTCQR